MVSFDSNGGSDVKQQVVESNGHAYRPADPKRDGYLFLGWYKNANESKWDNTFDFSGERINSNIVLTALWANAVDDTDKDGLLDSFERYINTDIDKVDTDHDGITDYQEVVILGTDPHKIDTDNNGISDYNDDEDMDNLSNGKEFEITTNPCRVDTDFDGLNDCVEVEIYNTSPIKSDTDDDGADDQWEISNGFDPLKYNDSFEVVIEAPDLRNSEPISAEVKMDVSGEQVSTIEIKRVTPADNPLISNGIPGYLGCAYDFSIEGEFSEAELTFWYDRSLGKLYDDFEPRVYYLNETTGELVELADQIVDDGVVRAKTSHFSTYLLLNKSDVDMAWSKDIKPNMTKNDPVEMAFVIDYSGSMKENDPDMLFKDLSEGFIDKLRDDIDKAAIVKFISKAYIVSGLSNDKDVLKNSLSKIKYDDGKNTYSGTNGYSGIKAALGEFSDNSAVKARFILFLTDGQDTVDSDYSDLIQECNDRDIKVYSIGVGDAIDGVLESMATKTGGRYYKATSSNASGTLIELNDAFKDIQNETVDVNYDSNEDGIPDYYNELIKNGELKLSTGADLFYGFDFNYDKNDNPSDDYDGDGIKNGDELQIMTSGDRVFLYMKSNPTLVHSDSDGIDDYEEIKQGTDPLRNQFSEDRIALILDSKRFNYSRNQWGYLNIKDVRYSMEAVAIIYHVWDIKKLYEDAMIDYFSKYCDNQMLSGIEEDEMKKNMINVLDNLLDYVKTGTQYAKNTYEKIKMIKRVTGLIDRINGAKKQDVYLWIEKCDEVISGVVLGSKDKDFLTIESGTLNSNTVKKINLTELGESVKPFIKGAKLTYKAGKSIYEISKVNANLKTFQYNIDILNELVENSPDEHMREAARVVMLSMIDAFSATVIRLGDSSCSEVFETVISKLAEANIYIATIEVVRGAVEVIVNYSKDIEQFYEMVCYGDMSDALICLVSPLLSHEGKYYYFTNNEDTYRYVTHAAQIRILGERKYCEYEQKEGIRGWFDDNAEAKKAVEKTINSVRESADMLGLSLSEHL